MQRTHGQQSTLNQGLIEHLLKVHQLYYLTILCIIQHFLLASQHKMPTIQHASNACKGLEGAGFGAHLKERPDNLNGSTRLEQNLIVSRTALKSRPRSTFPQFDSGFIGLPFLMVQPILEFILRSLVMSYINVMSCLNTMVQFQQHSHF